MAASKSSSPAKRVARSPVKCLILDARIATLADFFTLAASLTKGPYWFRGQSHWQYDLAPSALRDKTEQKRNAALSLLSQFRRVAEIKLPRPPAMSDELKWVQLAQHYGVPTRLLDWTESATVALFFACGRPADDGIVFCFNPIDLNRQAVANRPEVFDGHSDSMLIAPYLRLKGGLRANGRRTIAINPVWNSERLMIQRGVFTLHGNRKFSLDSTQAPSLVGFPILSDFKPALREELARVGVDEMTLFPEIEHACNHLKWRAGL